MRLKEYYEVLNLGNNDRLLVSGMNAMAICLYAAGKAKAAGISVAVQAAVDPRSPMKSEADAIEWAKANEPDAAEAIAAGGKITFSAAGILDAPPSQPFNKILVVDDDFANKLAEKLAKLNLLSSGDKALLLDLPASFFRPFELQKKGLFGKPERLSFRQLLARLGIEVGYYEVHDRRLVCGCTLKKPAEVPKFEIPGCDKVAAEIRAEILDDVLKAAGGSKFAMDAGEWLYFVDVADTENSALNMTFVFLDCSSIYSGEKPKPRSKKFTVAVMPNTESFRRELGARGVTVVKREKVKELFAERKG
jgi:hypothetical protein